MSSKYFLDVDITTGELVRRTAIVASSGGASADKVIRTGPDGKIDVTFIPDMTTATESIQASADIATNAFVTISNTSGRRVREALGSDNTRVAMGFCPVAAVSSTMATVYFGGMLVFDATGLVATDEGKLLFLSAAAAGKASKTPPSADNNIVQVVARIIEVATNARIQLILGERYIRILPAA